MEQKHQEEQVRTLNQQLLLALTAKWKAEASRRRERVMREQHCCWLAKMVETSFDLNGEHYTIYPNDIGLSSSGWDQGLMEGMQREMKEDLESYGATNVCNRGFLD